MVDTAAIFEEGAVDKAELEAEDAMAKQQTGLSRGKAWDRKVVDTEVHVEDATAQK